MIGLAVASFFSAWLYNFHASSLFEIIGYVACMNLRSLHINFKTAEVKQKLTKQGSNFEHLVGSEKIIVQVENE